MEEKIKDLLFRVKEWNANNPHYEAMYLDCEEMEIIEKALKIYLADVITNE